LSMQSLLFFVSVSSVYFFSFACSNIHTLELT
jgi:hypothetical protein